MGFLLASDGISAPSLPGGDGLTLEDVLSCYPAAVVAGQVPDRRQLCERFPDLADEVEAFFGRYNPSIP